MFITEPTAAGGVSTATRATRETVVTVTGEIAPDALGAVLPREHLLGDFNERAMADAASIPLHQHEVYRARLTMAMLGEVEMGAPNQDNGRLDDMDLAIREVAAFKLAGGGALVDTTTADRGRDPAKLRHIAETTGLTIVMGSGGRHPAQVAGIADHDSLAERIVRDLIEGVDGVRAGIIGAIAALDPQAAGDRAVLIAAARASAITGAAISLDRSPGPAATRRVLDLLAEHGADLTRVVVGHCDVLSPTPDELAPLLERGVFVQFDQLGRLPSVLSAWDDQDVAAAVLELARGGHGNQILLSHDISAKARLLAYGGGGYAFLLAQFVPYLRMLGADDALIETITVRNPRRLLTIPARGAQA